MRKESNFVPIVMEFLCLVYYRIIVVREVCEVPYFRRNGRKIVLDPATPVPLSMPAVR